MKFTVRTERVNAITKHARISERNIEAYRFNALQLQLHSGCKHFGGNNKTNKKVEKTKIYRAAARGASVKSTLKA